MSGGTNYWRESPEKYLTSHNFELLSDNAEKKVLEIAETVQEQGYFQYEVACNMPGAYYGKQTQHKFRVDTKQSNQATRLLLRPVVHTHSIQFHCEPPSAAQLHWAQKLSNPDPAQLKKLPKHRVSNGEKLYFVLVNSQHYLRTLMIDRDTQVFFNHSSIATEVRSSNETLL